MLRLAFGEGLNSSRTTPCLPQLQVFKTTPRAPLGQPGCRKGRRILPWWSASASCPATPNELLIDSADAVAGATDLDHETDAMSRAAPAVCRTAITAGTANS